MRVTKASFPAPPSRMSRRPWPRARCGTKERWPASAQALQANLAIAQASSRDPPVKNDRRRSCSAARPCWCCRRRAGAAPGKRRRFAVARDQHHRAHAAGPVVEEFYLWAAGRWWQAATWRGNGAPPRRLRVRGEARAALADQFNRRGEGRRRADHRCDQPTELLQSKGEPQLSPIPGTSLYVTNSPNDIFLSRSADRAATYFVLISGDGSREGAYRAVAYVAGKALPADFAKIPADHPMRTC